MKLHPVAGILLGAVLASIVWVFVYNANATMLDAAQKDLRQARSEKSQCIEKLARGTILYDVGILGSETKAWYIPADVEPVRLSGTRGTFSHYDPKTQNETIHMAAKTQ
jgi:hypothetical protein